MNTIDTIPYQALSDPQGRTNNCTIVCNLDDEATTHLLKRIAGIDDSDNYTQQFTNEDSSLVPYGFFFKKGILLANLSLMENITLPYNYYYHEMDLPALEKDIGKWVSFFKLNIDLQERPAMVSVSVQKMISYIRTILLKPDVYILDDPYFQISNIYKKKIIYCLAILKENKKMMIIGTTDIEIITALADEIIVVSCGEVVFHQSTVTFDKSIMIENATTCLNRLLNEL